MSLWGKPKREPASIEHPPSKVEVYYGESFRSWVIKVSFPHYGPTFHLFEEEELAKELARIHYGWSE